MVNVIHSETSVSGSKNVTYQAVETPFGVLNVRIAVRGHKSSEGDQVFDPPADVHEPDGAEESTEGSQ